jgi:hypothetical protein
MSLFQQEKRVLLPVLALVLVGVLVASYLLLPGTKKEPDDFRGIKWGSNLRDLPEMRLLAEEGNLKFFEKAKDPTRIGEVEVDKIVYGFYKDRFYNVMIYYSSPADFARLREVLAKEFGPPFQPGESDKKCFWNGDQVNLLLSFDEASTTGRIIYLFKPIQLEIEVSG